MDGGGEAAGDRVDSSNDVGKEVTLKIRCTNGSQLVVQVNLNSTLESFKSILAHRCRIPAHQQRLIYRGHILKGDQTLESFGIEEDHTIHLVRGFATAEPADNGVQNTNPISTTDAASNQGGPLGGSDSGSPLFPGLGLSGLDGIFTYAFPDIEQMQQMLTQNPDMIRDIINTPDIQDIMSNPETIHNLMINNPQMREVMDRNPELSHILNDPSTLHQTMEAARNPEIMREMMRNTDRAMNNIESSPEGFNMLRRMYENVQEPLLNASIMAGDNGFDIRSDEFSPLLAAPSGRPGSENSTNSHAPNTNPLPNPWASAGAGGMPRNLHSQVNPTGNIRSDSSDGLGGQGFRDLERMPGLTPDNASSDQVMQNPIFLQLMRNHASSPQHMIRYLGLRSELENMLDSDPQFRAMLQNPELFRQIIYPETMQHIEQIVNVQGLPVGRQPSQEPGQNGDETAGAADDMGLDQLLNIFDGIHGLNAPNRPQVPPEELYATELSQLREMGFFDTAENIRALIATTGNVYASIERLLGNPTE